MDNRRLRDKIQIKHICEIWDVSRDTVSKAKGAGELEFLKNGWIEASKVAKWAAEKGIEKRVKQAAAPGTEEREISGGGLFGDELLRMLQKIHIPSDVVMQAEDAEKTAKAIIGAIQAQEKQARLLRDAGRLGDVNELSAIMDAVISNLTAAAKSLPDELTPKLSRKHDIKSAKMSAVLEDVGVYMAKVYEASIAELEKRKQAFEDEKTAELKQRARRAK